jgi:hypothetical protein
LHCCACRCASHNAVSTPAALVRGCSIATNRAQNRKLSAMTRFKSARNSSELKLSEHVLTSTPRQTSIHRIALGPRNWAVQCWHSPGGDSTCFANGRATSTASEEFMRTFSLLITGAAFLACAASSAYARPTYDGSWDLLFVTQRGACDPSYSFTVNVSNGIVTHPNLVKFKGYVAHSGAVRASVTVHDKYASGVGRLSGASGRGTWSGYSGSARCSGYWTAQRN